MCMLKCGLGPMPLLNQIGKPYTRLYMLFCMSPLSLHMCKCALTTLAAVPTTQIKCLFLCRAGVQ